MRHVLMFAFVAALLAAPALASELGSCRRLATAVGELDAVLGDDVDLPT